MSGLLAEASLLGESWSVPILRHFVGHVLTVAGHKNVDSARLVTSELVGNAVLHMRSARPGGLVTVEVAQIGDQLARIDVMDEGSDSVPTAREASDGECRGRGLRLVENLSVRWGVVPQALGWKTVWAEVLTVADAPAPMIDMSLCDVNAW